MAGLTATLGAAPALLTSRSASAATPGGRNKLVFISDIHMNVDAPYSWLSSHTQQLAQFLESLLQRDDVAELIIIGDLLDDWVSPVEIASSSFANILSASINQNIVNTLKAICQDPNIKVTYLTGNHDLLSFEQQNKAIIQAAFPGMTIISEAPGVGAYSKDNVIWAEHGHKYTLFNAPDTWSKPGSQLPLGYFISRLAASSSVKTGQIKTTPELLDEFVKSSAANLKGGLQAKNWPRKLPRTKADNGIYDDAFILLVYYAIAAYCGYNPLNSYIMNGLDGFSPNPSVLRIGGMYDKIFSKWGVRQDVVSAFNAILGDIGTLGPAASLLFEMPSNIQPKYPFTPKIILFGHTHEAVFQSQQNGDTANIYINTGTWIDSVPSMTWSEIECEYGVNGKNNYTAALWYYGDNAPRYQGTVSVPV